MKGVILAGGKGTRLYPLTKVVNKHLLPVGQKPMLQHAVDKMTAAGIREIMIVTGGEHIGGIAEFFGSGKDFGCEFTYRVQDEAGGIAQALGLARGFIRGAEKMCVVLGDNVFEDSLKRFVDDFECKPAGEAMVTVCGVPDPERFGVAEIEAFIDKSVFVNEGQERKQILNSTDYFNYEHPSTRFIVRGIDEKPENPKTTFAVTGIYFYDCDVFDIVANLKPSGRGELEITDVNNEYIKRDSMSCSFWRGWWSDAGTMESYAHACSLVNQGER